MAPRDPARWVVLIALVFMSGLISVSAEPASASTGARLIVFNHARGVLVRNRAQADERLVGTKPGFRAFAARLGHRADVLGQTACGFDHDGVWIQAYLSTGWGAGEGDDCASLGAETIFHRTDRGWKILMGTQEFWDCAKLRRQHVPLRLLKVVPMSYDAQHNCFNYGSGTPGNYSPR